MSWLARSIANSLRLDDDDDDENDDVLPSSSSDNPRNPNHPQSVEELESEEEDEDDDEDGFDNQGRGVREDLSEFKETLTRQLWGVASFLAPIKTHHPTDRSVGEKSRRDPLESTGQSVSGDVSFEDVSDSVRDSGFRGKFGHFGGCVRNNISDVSKFPYGSEDPNDDAVGVTEEVLAFAGNVAHHPETWLDFPLSEEEEMDDFDMSDAQIKHASAVERLSPRLAALRIELCPAHMSVGYFWKVYFVLLHSRLSKQDAELLSTPRVVEARAMWIQELQKQTKPHPDWFGRSPAHPKETTYPPSEDFDHISFDGAPGNTSLRKFGFEPTTYSAAATAFETEKHPVISTEVQVIDKSVLEEESATKIRNKEVVTGGSHKIKMHDYDDGDDWLEEHSELVGYNGADFLAGNEEDFSFSDLEDDVDCTMPMKSKIISKRLDTSSKTS